MTPTEPLVGIYGGFPQRPARSIQSALPAARLLRKNGWKCTGNTLTKKTAAILAAQNSIISLRTPIKSASILCFLGSGPLQPRRWTRDCQLPFSARTVRCSMRFFHRTVYQHARDFRDPIIALLGALAKQEKIRLSERVKAGLETAKKKGKRLGRKPIAPIEIKAVINAYEEEREKRSEDISVRRLAALTGRHRSVCHRILTDYKAGKLDKDGFRYDDPLFDLNTGVSKTPRKKRS